MKKMFVIALTVWAIMLLLPLSVIGKETEIAKTEVISLQKNEKVEKKETFKVLDKDSNKITEMDSNEYIYGVVAAEMPALYDEEALKAQAVAAYTFALKRSQENSDKEYDITTDFKVDQSFVSKSEIKEKWGENAQKYEDKISNAVKEAEGYVIKYKNEPILSVYHAVSGGKTENCSNVWGMELDYLKPVLSEWDKLYENYISEEEFTAEELKAKFPNVEFSGKEAEYFSEPVYTDSQTVKKINLCSKEFTGEEIRSTLNLRSANFKVQYTDKKFVFTVYGYGHGVGMSQYGADYMAKQGSDFKEILTYYYTDCKVEK